MTTEPPHLQHDAFERRIRAALVLIAVPAVLAIVWAAPALMTLLLALACGVAAWEYSGMSPRASPPAVRAVPGAAVALVVAGGVLWPADPGLATLALLAGGAGLVGVILPRQPSHPLAMLVTILYLGLLPSTGVALRYTQEGGAWVTAALAVTWGGDIAGFVVGRRFGRHPLAPGVSPRKTLEGAIASFLAGTLLGTLALGLDSGPGVIVLLAVANLAGQAGDLFESLLKRRAHVKDSSHLLGVQGGLLDTLDGLCFAFPVLYAGRALLWQ